MVNSKHKHKLEGECRQLQQRISRSEQGAGAGAGPGAGGWERWHRTLTCRAATDYRADGRCCWCHRRGDRKRAHATRRDTNETTRSSWKKTEIKWDGARGRAGEKRDLAIANRSRNIVLKSTVPCSAHSSASVRDACALDYLSGSQTVWSKMAVKLSFVKSCFADSLAMSRIYCFCERYAFDKILFGLSNCKHWMVFKL